MKKLISWFPLCRYIIPSEFENWLEKQALNGWHIEKLNVFSFFHFTFKKANPKKYRYVLDLNPLPNKDYNEMYIQFGWEPMGRISNFFIWRQEYSDERPESFTDRDSLINRNKRIRNAIKIMFFVFIFELLVLVAGIAVCIIAKKYWKCIELIILLGVFSSVTYYLSRLLHKINQHISDV